VKLLLLALACVGLVDCTAAAPRASQARRVAQLAPVTGGLFNLVRDATRLDQVSSDARFDALIALLGDRDLAFEIQPFSSGRTGDPPAEGRNVWVTVGEGDRDLIVGAHADAVVLDDGSLGHGMVDNAAAVVVLIRVAEALQRYALQHRIRVVFFDLEELGLLGSRHFVESLDPSRVDGMVNLDIAGYGDTVIFGPTASDGNTRVHRAVRQVCAEAEHECLAFSQFPESDDRSFQSAGIPNVSLATLPRLEARQLWLLLNAGDDDSGLRGGLVPAILRTIHSPADTVAALDPDGMTLAYNMVMRVLLRLDRVPD
jgi:Zn-dependent M28 family amino/carboxypeptidase